MSQNLKLALCPSCGDTKHVKKKDSIILLPASTQYECTECSIHWYLAFNQSEYPVIKAHNYTEHWEKDLL